jgi:hypothetical protein
MRTNHLYSLFGAQSSPYAPKKLIIRVMINDFAVQIANIFLMTLVACLIKLGGHVATSLSST